MPVPIRKTEPECIRYILSAAHSFAKQGSPILVNRIVDIIARDTTYNKGFALEMTQNAIGDGILVYVTDSSNTSNSRKNTSEQSVLQLAKPEEIKTYSHDPYCFECHRPGFLEGCIQCQRSFHRLCYRKNPDRPNYAVPSGKQQKNPLPAFGSSTDSESESARSEVGNEDETESQAAASCSIISNTSTQDFEERHSSDNNATMEAFLPSASDTDVTNISFNNDDKASLQSLKDIESKTDVDVVFLGELRPPTRKRPASGTINLSYKTEISQIDEEDMERQLCTCCRLLKTAILRNPPNLGSSELCYLIKFSFVHNRSWVRTDIAEYLKTIKWPKVYVDALTKFLFTGDIITLDRIKEKLDQKSYNYIIEFFVDILNFQHNIGVFFGTKGVEFESSKWLVRDICHDLGEIRRCPDCFRHSHEKDCSIWFAKPCLQRHELVFAKHSGFSYWPAKVMRVIGNNKYDVRFFGSDHSRALVDVLNIRPIDAEWSTLKIRSTKALRNAMKELHYHQILSGYPADLFAYGSDKVESSRVIRSVMCEEQQMDENEKSVSKTPQKQVQSTLSIQISDESDQASAVIAKKSATVKLINNSKRLTRSILEVDPNEIREVKRKLTETRKREFALKYDNDNLRKKLKKLKDTVKKHEYEISIIKRKQWCNWCLQEAIYPCCFKASYCSEVCQIRHWKQTHENECLNSAHQKERNC